MVVYQSGNHSSVVTQARILHRTYVFYNRTFLSWIIYSLLTAIRSFGIGPRTGRDARFQDLMLDNSRRLDKFCFNKWHCNSKILQTPWKHLLYTLLSLICTEALSVTKVCCVGHQTTQVPVLLGFADPANANESTTPISVQYSQQFNKETYRNSSFDGGGAVEKTREIIAGNFLTQ